MEASIAQTAREALFRGSYKDAYRSCFAWMKEEPDSFEAHYLCAQSVARLSGRAFTRKEEFLQQSLEAIRLSDAAALAEHYPKILACLEERFAPYLRVRPGFVFSSAEEAKEYFDVVEEMLTLTHSLYQALPEGATTARVITLRPIGRYCRIVREAYYFEEMTVVNNIPTRKKNRVRYGLVRSFRASSIYRACDKDFQALAAGTEEEETLIQVLAAAKTALDAGKHALEEAQASGDKLEQLRAQTTLSGLQDALSEAEAELASYRKDQGARHL